MHPLLVDQPTFSSQQRPHPTVAVAGILLREPNYPLGQPAIPLRLAAHVALARSVLADHPARPTLGDPQLLPNLLDGSPPPGRAQTFPLLTSFRMSISSSFSATNFFRRAFSFSSSLSRLASE